MRLPPSKYPRWAIVVQLVVQAKKVNAIEIHIYFGIRTTVCKDHQLEAVIVYRLGSTGYDLGYTVGVAGERGQGPRLSSKTADGEMGNGVAARHLGR